jgi:hypothetical protein
MVQNRTTASLFLYSWDVSLVDASICLMNLQFKMIPAAIVSFVLHAAYVFAAPLAGPSVSLGNATFVGTTFGTTEKYLGIPFAQPP